MNQLKYINQPKICLRVSDQFSTDTFIRCTQTAQSVNNPIFLINQEITQQNNPADADINEVNKQS